MFFFGTALVFALHLNKTTELAKIRFVLTSESEESFSIRDKKGDHDAESLCQTDENSVKKFNRHYSLL